MSPRRALTAGQASRLRGLGDAVRRATGGDHGPAIRLAVAAVREYRAAGAGYDEMARALGVDATVLRDWMEQHAPTRPTIRGGPPLEPWSPLARPRPSPDGSGILACTGDPRPGGNNFATELRTIRDRVDPPFRLTEHSMIEVGELASCLNRARPLLLHIAAHSQHGAVFLTRGGTPVSILHAHLGRALLAAAHRPSILVLNFCRSIELVTALEHAVPSIVCWPDGVDDGQCAELSDVLYRALGGGRATGQAMDAVQITLPRHDGLPQPLLIGSRTTGLR